ncbi:MAG TPA: DUF4288 domain-containing protein [Chitinophagaceae bacterium]|nr:DUF4288 domain-containing protein [Chitinophagaceae bacterium]
MNWYLAKIVYRIVCGDGDHTPQFDEQLRLINAPDKKEAFYKAQHTGIKEEEKFYNLKHELVQWKFINVSELYKIGEMIDGAELYSRIEERDDGDVYTDIVNKKALGILHSDSHQLLQLI